ncbi:aminotransferase class V-fold PLP-dependent enzyme [Pelomonas sp. CA6]|uniref:aminotransferase class V-fold PLP-dependent enzyme n=1 Tax=Pelomonas sp. CA6 TaxID=2907999 RepID=UPI001F4A559B|nr:aminotransferase class V-fold PLP-dependent enzyme [Pelomonas sp. CA6]MCH7342752.1 aminotransferase class V-fold PLP-dependent enzyme [Pelomonas sp. CA6]
MPGLLPDVDPDGLLEYSVVYTDRALNHMSRRFQHVMCDLSGVLKSVYHARSAIVVPGSGTFGMEAVARQFAGGRKTLVLRNGWFSYRWTQIFEMGRIPSEQLVLKARPLSGDAQAPYAPPPLDEVVETLRAQRPELVFAPHVETASGLLLPDDYLRAVAKAAHEVGALFVLDCIASGALWVDMESLGVDVLISAPQKGWSGSPCCAFVMLSERARALLDDSSSTSFAMDLRRWLQIMEAYENGGHAYHATLPTDALARCRDAMLESRGRGFEALRDAQIDLGRRVRAMLRAHGLPSVAAPGFEASGVVVSYTEHDGLHSGKALAAEGLQSAAGVPLQCDEGPGFKTFRIGLFGLDKLAQPQRTVAALDAALGRVLGHGPRGDPA